MLQLSLPACTLFDERTEEFIDCPAVHLKLEHSLISIQRWESKWHKSYLSSKGLTHDEILDYIRCMSLDPNIDPSVIRRLTSAQYAQIRQYIEDPMTATTFHNDKGKGRNMTITAEIVYYWMTSFGIPFECAKWHINQLLTLIQVCGIKNNPKKGKTRQSAKSRADLNKARRARLGTSG